jgi:hypothetical protein
VRRGDGGGKKLSGVSTQFQKTSDTMIFKIEQLFLGKEAAIMGRKKKIPSVRRLEEMWAAYREDCDQRTMKRTDFSPKLGIHVTSEVPAPVSYEIKGFCAYIGMTEQNFYATYNKDPDFESVIARMRQDCENSKREGFEQGRYPSQLAGLWMSRYGYTVRQDTNVTGNVPVVFGGEDDLED